jgi:hypothetical protein
MIWTNMGREKKEKNRSIFCCHAQYSSRDNINMRGRSTWQAIRTRFDPFGPTN